MTLASRRPPDLAEVLRVHRDEIIVAWAKKVKDIPGSQYQVYPLDEITRWASQGLEAIIETIDTGSDQAPDKYLNEIAIARLHAGSPIYEVTEGLLLSKEAILPIISSSSDDPTIAFEWVAQLDACLRIVIGRFEHQFKTLINHPGNVPDVQDLPLTDRLYFYQRVPLWGASPGRGKSWTGWGCFALPHTVPRR